MLYFAGVLTTCIYKNTLWRPDQIDAATECQAHECLGNSVHALKPGPVELDKTIWFTKIIKIGLG